MALSLAQAPHALVTGARGFLGRHVTRALADAGWRVSGLGHGSGALEPWAAPGLQAWVAGDLTCEGLQRFSEVVGPPDLVVHLAGGSSVLEALRSPEEDRLRTVGSTQQLLAYLRASAPGATLVAISSAAVYGDGHAGPIEEGTPLQPCSPYGWHKLRMEELCLEHAAACGQPTLIPRLFSVFGPGLHKQLFWDVCSRLRESPEILLLGGTGEELRDWAPASEIARALLHLAPRASSQPPVLNVGTGRGTSVRQAVTSLLRLWPRLVWETEASTSSCGGEAREERARAEHLGDADSIELAFDGCGRPGDPQRLVAAASMLEATGFRWSFDFDACLEGYVRWFLEQRGQLS